MIDPQAPDFTDIPGGPRRPRFGYAPAPGALHPARPPLATVVTPFHNAGDLARQTARCVLGQSLQDFEWVIVNDHSTDGPSLALLQELRAADPRVRVIDLPANAGPGAARNAGFAGARSDFVYQLDADDLIEPTALEKSLWFLVRHPGAAFCHSFEVGFGAQNYLWFHGFHAPPEMFLNECPVGAHTVMARRGVHEAIGGYDESIRGGFEDWEYILRAADRGAWGVTLPEFLAWYRRRGDHGSHWADWDGGERQRAFHDGLKRRYADLFDGLKPFPRIPRLREGGPEPVERQLPVHQTLRKDRARALLVAEGPDGGADGVRPALIDELASAGWEATVAFVGPGPAASEAAWCARTPDVFWLGHLLPVSDHPLFLRYLVESRRPDVVLLGAGEFGYAVLPYLRAMYPGPVFVDLAHSTPGSDRHDGRPSDGYEAAAQLDLSLARDGASARGLVKRGRDEARVAVLAPEPGGAPMGLLLRQAMDFGAVAPRRAFTRDRAHGCADRAVDILRERSADGPSPARADFETAGVQPGGAEPAP